MTQKNSSGKPRLAFIGMKGLPPDRPGAGGGERETDAKTRRLAARGYEVTVYGRWNYMGRSPEPYHGIRLISLPSLNKAGLEMLSHTFLSTLHAIFTNNADVVSYHGMGNAIFLPLLKLGRKRTVVYMDGIDWERPKWGRSAKFLLKMAAHSAFRWADVVYVDNEVSRQQFVDIFGRSPQLITLAADLWDDPGHDQLAGLGLEPGNYILFVGMLRPDKGVHLLIDAYTRLEADSATDIPLVIVGDNPDDPAYVQGRKDAANDQVRFLGYQYGDTARQLFANSMIYVQPSVMEGNSPALMSAMACGRCVVVNGIPQNRETIGDAGLAFEAGNSDDLRRILAELLADPERVAALGKQARQRIVEVYNWERVVDELEEMYLGLDGQTFTLSRNEQNHAPDSALSVHEN
jgi:glycosyltransferase involved in cell wall biosynthesis